MGWFWAVNDAVAAALKERSQIPSNLIIVASRQRTRPMVPDLDPSRDGYFVLPNWIGVWELWRESEKNEKNAEEEPVKETMVSPGYGKDASRGNLAMTLRPIPINTMVT